MPFKSEAQRRYLWANEPEIARDWTDTYGSKIQAANGGIMRLGFYNGGNPHKNGYGSSQTSTGHEKGGRFDTVNTRRSTPSTTVTHDNRDDRFKDYAHSYKTPALSDLDHPEKRDYFQQSWTGPKGWFGGGGYQNLNVPGDTGARHQSRFGIGNLMGGMFAGWPGAISSFLSKFNLRGYNPDGTPRTQAEYEENRRKNQIKNQIDRLKKTRDFGKYANDPEGWAASTLSSRLAGLEQDVFGKDYVDHSRNVLKARDALGINTLEPDMVKEYRLADYIDVNPSLTQFGGSPRMNYIAPRPINTNIEPDDPFRAFNYTTIA